MIAPLIVLIGKRLKSIPVIGKLVDERFLHHRLRALRTAGMVGFIVADLLFGYRFLVNHVRNWDLLAVVMSVVVAYVALIIWYLITE